jgi:hypothetical protein
MFKTTILFLISLCLFLLQPFSRTTQADEGMWLLNQFPSKAVETKYGFKATKPWLDHVRLSSARLAGGCSGSFISKDGLVMTNHHCAHSCIEQLSNSKKDFVADGFYAKTLSDEVKCPEIEVNRLTDISDVTDQVTAATKGLSGREYFDAQKGIMSRIEKECAAGSDNVRCDVVTLFHGGKYHLYKYQRYQDVRLVFAPEFAIAFFGGDPDNFMFPRYDLDLSLLRVYENGKPLQNPEYFRWSQKPAADGDLTFVTGHPGHTSRLLTMSELEFQRDVQLRRATLYLSELRGMLTEFQNRGPEEKRISDPLLFGVENSLKALKGRDEALLDKDFMAKKQAQENTLRKKVNANPKLKKEYGSAWDEIAKAEKRFNEIYPSYSLLERNRGFNSKLYGIAQTLVRAAVELPKPNEKRFREFAESKLPELKQDLFSEAPIYDELEIANLTFALTKVREGLGADDPAVKRILGQQSPAEIAAKIVKNTKLRNIDIRKSLFEGGQKAIESSKDPMIQFALLVDPEARAVRKKFEDDVESVLNKHGERVAKAQFAVYGSSTYPDATFTLRVSYGQIKGYKENDRQIKPITTFQGTFDRATGRDPFALPQSWLNSKSSLDMSTPMDFCSTNDIIGGNSGSPVINQNAEIVGLIFDGNIQSLGGDYGFDPSVNRAVAVHSSAITEALKKIYHADRIVNELNLSREAVTR